MKITHIVWSLLTGGIETMLVNIINEQVKSEEVELVIVNNLYYDPLLNKLSPLCKVRFCKRTPGSKNPWPIIKLNYWLLRFSPDVVHHHSCRTSYLVKGRYNMVRTIHSTRIYSTEYPRMKALFSISESVRDDTLKQGCDSIVIENGIPTGMFKRKEKYIDKNDCYHLVQVSRLDVSQKGQDILIRAINELVNKRKVTNLHLHFIGEGDSRTALEKMVSDFNLDGYITFEGVKTQEFLYEHLCDYDCFVQPSRYEGFGLTVAEAMAAGLPVLVSDIEGPMEIIDNGRVGMAFKTEDVSDLADKLEIILGGGYDYSMIDNAIERVRQKYDVSVTAQKYINEYRRILK